MTEKQQFHKYCLMFPQMAENDLDALASDIYENGLHQPIVTFRKQIIDGRSRFEACQKFKIKPDFVEWAPSKNDLSDEDLDRELYAFCISQNVFRRHLSTSQRAVIACQHPGFKQGDNQHTGDTSKTTVKDAAKLNDVGERSVTRARRVVDKTSDAVVEAVKNGKATIRDAERIVEESTEVQDAAAKAVNDGSSKTLTDAVKTINKATSFDPAEFDHAINPDVPPSKVSKGLSLEKQIEQQAQIFERFARGLTKWFDDNLPDNVWLDESTKRICRDQVAAAAATIRLYKAVGICTRCNGKGCETCRKTGYVNKRQQTLNEAAAEKK
ncbi:MAG: hypothetical protein FJ267_08590 [Planctomycetes bacterium]|nr:hypothetical protein [Planctomycetota bacterium]